MDPKAGKLAAGSSDKGGGFFWGEADHAGLRVEVYAECLMYGLLYVERETDDFGGGSAASVDDAEGVAG